MGFTGDIIPNPDWGNPFPNVEPEEWNDDDEEIIEIEEDDDDFE